MIRVRVETKGGQTLYLVSSSFNRSGWALTQTKVPHEFGSLEAAQRAWDKHYPWDTSMRGYTGLVPVYEGADAVAPTKTGTSAWDLLALGGLDL